MPGDWIRKSFYWNWKAEGIEIEQCGSYFEKRGRKTIKAGGMWVFDNEIDRISGSFENGDTVEVHDFDGYFMGYGFINTKSKITVRMMSRRKENPVTEELIERRVRAAWDYR